MIGEIIAIGDELISGRILNTTSYFAASQLFAAGHEIVAMMTIGDNPALIGQTLINSLERADFVVVTGGLGATTDDLTNAAVSDALQRPTTFYPEILENIRANSKRTPKQVQLSLEKLAWLPAGAHALKSDAQMAGHFLVHDGKPVFFLPGVPHEMKELLVETVISRLAVWEGEDVREVRQKLYRVVNLAETEINRQLDPLAKNDQRVRIGYYPVFPEVHVSLTVTGHNGSEVEELFKEQNRQILVLLGDDCYGTDTETLEEVVGKLLTRRHLTLALAESCTGGLVAHRLTKVSGSSGYFVGGVVAYSNNLKERLLKVDRDILVKFGAVSAETARAMAAGICAVTGADYGLAVTGVAGPTGGTDEKPVGTVYFGLAGPGKTSDFMVNFFGDRWQVQEATAHYALDLIRRELNSF
ncbi:MAG: CinA family nicotinamide mononucleotide deamidase-related protein [Proteobacteria bacterium]|nr:CinA family nicotinamide mononucleotide deamidase-related protein [Pseudomonadota bacterium]MBU1716815.1 CinA family nicotinamide mononucleotide deamidase-related protein [Pseudomonadota bacterium]